MRISDWSSDVCSSDLATNETRGSLLSVYMLVILGGMAASQYLLNFADINSFVLFALASALISMALVPISVSATPTPDFTAPEPLGLRALSRTSPPGTIGALGTGMANPALYPLAAAHAGPVGLTVPQLPLLLPATNP